MINTVVCIVYIGTRLNHHSGHTMKRNTKKLALLLHSTVFILTFDMMIKLVVNTVRMK